MRDRLHRITALVDRGGGGSGGRVGQAAKKPLLGCLLYVYIYICILFTSFGYQSSTDIKSKRLGGPSNDHWHDAVESGRMMLVT